MEMRTRRLRVAAMIALLGLLSVACGQLPNVHEGAVAQGDGLSQTGTRTGGAGGTTGGGSGTDGAGTTRTTTGADGSGGGGTTQTSVGTGGSGGTAGTAGTAGGTGGDDDTGATGDEPYIFEDKIVVGVHAPVTGAAPVESTAFEAGKDLYWRFLHEVKGETVFGKQVEVVFRDDQYSPNTAVKVCQDMVEQENAFLLLGAAGTDQIKACAQYANRNGVPFLSNGVTEKGLLNFDTYFAISSTYNDQGPLTAQMVLNKNGRDEMDVMAAGGLQQPDGNLRIAFVKADTPNFDDAEEGFRQGLEEQGFNTQACDGPDGDCYEVYNLPKKDSPTLGSAIAATVQDMSQKGIDVVNNLIAPVVVVQFVEEADKRGYRPNYVAVGVSTVNAVANVLCDSSPESYHGSDIFFPWPGWWEVRDGQFDPEFQQAVNHFEDAKNHDTVGDGDLMLSLWAGSKILHEMFKQAGPDATRERFIRALEEGQPIETGLYPTLRYGAQDGAHFGTKEMHLLEARCHSDSEKGAHGEFHEVDPFVSGY